MRHAILIAAATFAVAAPLAAQMPGSANPALVTAGTYKVDSAHTQVTWSLNHMGFSMLQGQFGASEGTLTVDPARPAATKLDVTFAINELSVTSGQFANHLKSKDFFDAATYPTARFVSTAVKVNGRQVTVTGNLTIKDQTKPVTLTGRFVGAGTNPMSKKLNFGFEATGSIKRSDFGLGYAVPAVGDAVTLQVNAAFSA